VSKESKAGSARRIQYAALPYRLKAGSGLEILLVTSRGTRRWIIPKGWPKSGLAPHETAMEEAFEEAGVIGKVSKKPIGSYSYQKAFSKRDAAKCRVQVFPMQVARQHKTWPECRERRAEWYSPAAAARAVTEVRLRRLIQRFTSKLRQPSKRPPVSAATVLA
jgi:8-oxo-dGTP pyrophosphatase MutT (NUDIX family)